MSGQPKASFWVVVWLVAIGLAGFAAWQWGLFDGQAKRGPGNGQPMAGGGDAAGGAGDGAGEEGLLTEAADDVAPTTVQEYSFKPAERLPLSRRSRFCQI
jgi:hypothetical protein